MPLASNRTPAGTNSKVAKELSRQSKLITDMSETQDKKLDDIKQSALARETKLTEISERLNHVEGRLAFLEEANEGFQERPPATREEIERLGRKLDDIENQERRNNLHFVSFLEECENNDVRVFVGDVIPKIWGIGFPDWLVINRAHSIGARRPSALNQNQQPGALIARLLRFQERKCFAGTARQCVIWNGHVIVVFLDYSKSMINRRLHFNDCRNLSITAT